jgi:hypothetical protein
MLHSTFAVPCIQPAVSPRRHQLADFAMRPKNDSLTGIKLMIFLAANVGRTNVTILA